jgi:uncharacterized protein (DUF1800 family)
MTVATGAILSMLGAIGLAAGVSAQTTAITTADAARFLEQSSFGPTPATVAQVQQLGFSAYLAQQFTTPATGYNGYVYMDSAPAKGCPTTTAPKNCYRDNYSMFPIGMQFFRNAVSGPDQLRQRVAWALSQILVVSGLDERQPYAMAAYQNLLLNDAFGNFQQLLTDITLSPVMGDYLGMVNNNWIPNSKENDPNENYAREILQLYSIGLVQLNIDGSPVLDAGGQPVPTYGQDQIVGFAAVFTGWSYPPLPGATPKFGEKEYLLGVMPGFPTHHDNVGGETLLNGYSLPVNDNQGIDLTESVANIFNHPNVGPFIGKQLIQQLVTSNPSPAYVTAVAQVFNNDGNGVRGNMQAVITAILTNPEARSASGATDPRYGKLREPALMITNVLRGIGGATQTDGEFPSAASTNMSEPIFDSPTVFNYYQPTYPLPDSNLVGPPFGIYDAATAFARYEFANQLLYAPIPPDPSVTFVTPTGTSLDLSAWTAAAATPATLIAMINNRFFHGAMSSALQNIVTGLVTQIPATDPAGRAKAALYVAVTSPEFQVEL